MLNLFQPILPRRKQKQEYKMATSTNVSTAYKNEKYFNSNSDIKTLKLLQRNADVSITGYMAEAANFATSADTFSAVVQASSTTGSVTGANGSVTNIGLTSLFLQISSFFFGRNDSLIPLSNNINQTTNLAKAIFVNRPTLDEGIKPYSISANISCSGVPKSFQLGIIDYPITSSDIDLKLGQIGKLVVSSSTADQVGTVFYNYGLLLFHGGTTSNVANMFISNTGYNNGFSFGSVNSTLPKSASLTGVNINSLYYKTQKYIVRNIYFCRLFNDEFNFSSNPTSKQSDGTLIDTIQEVNSTYITTIGLYNNNDECLAVAKTSPPERKHWGNERTFAVSLDF